jgi:hypothetical protein
MMRDAAANAANSRAESSNAKQNFEFAKPHMPSAFSCISSAENFARRAEKILSHPQIT